MFDRISKEEQLLRALECEKLLNNSIYNSARLAVKAKIYDAFESAGYGDDKTRLNCQMQLKALDSVFNVFEKEVKNGKFAQKQLDMEKDKK